MQESLGTSVNICVWAQANSTSLLFKSFFFLFDMKQIPLIQNTFSQQGIFLEI